jgi:beta-glucanase (GH16 family)
MPARRHIGPLAAALALAGCGLLEAEGPPARTEGDVPGATDEAVPLPESRDVPELDAPSAGGDAPLVDPPLPGYTLAWREEFGGDALDPTRWNVREGRWRDALNSPDSVGVSGGLLTLVTFTDASGAHHAGYVNTRGKFEGRYGYYETRVRLWDSPGMWCAFWLYPDTIGNPLGDPGRAGVEIDVFEHRERDKYGWEMRDMVLSGLNWDGFGEHWKKSSRMVAHPDGAPLHGEWRRYSVLWTAEGYTFYIDEKPVFSTRAAVSHIPQPLYLTCEVKNDSWAGFIPPGGYGPREKSTARMEVDWVRVWTPPE